jgi:hypothetical protein
VADTTSVTLLLAEQKMEELLGKPAGAVTARCADGKYGRAFRLSRRKRQVARHHDDLAAAGPVPPGTAPSVLVDRAAAG